jgi:REP element-mobilizing transposase RayT
MKRLRQQEFKFRTWGGARLRAGRKRDARSGIPHRRRPEHKKEHPVHVTLRAVRRLPSLRRQSIFLAIHRAFGRTARSWFRIVHFSIQRDHVHLLVEASDKISLSRGLMGATIRLARAVNRSLRRSGRVFGDRYHARALRTPREVRHGLVYVIMNWKKHVDGATNFDPCSSVWSFTGWKIPPSVGPPEEWPVHAVTEPPSTWLLRTGWKRHGLIDASERPKPTA